MSAIICHEPDKEDPSRTKVFAWDWGTEVVLGVFESREVAKLAAADLRDRLAIWQAQDLRKEKSFGQILVEGDPYV